MKHLIRYTGIVAIGLMTLAGCHAYEGSANLSSTDKTAADLTLKLYSVPTDRTKSIQDTVDSALGGIDVKLFGGARASITTAGPGKLLVYAPRDVQASIGEAIESLTQAPLVQTVPVQVSVHFWVIDGEPGVGLDDASLKDLAGSLASLRQTTGPMHFHLDQAAALVGTGNEDGVLTTADGPYRRNFQFNISAINGDTARLQLNYEDLGSQGLGKLGTRIDATFGQYIVLAQAPGACPSPATNTTPGNCNNKPAMRLLVVRVDRQTPKA